MILMVTTIVFQHFQIMVELNLAQRQFGLIDWTVISIFGGTEQFQKLLTILMRLSVVELIMRQYLKILHSLSKKKTH